MQFEFLLLKWVRYLHVIVQVIYHSSLLLCPGAFITKHPLKQIRFWQTIKCWKLCFWFLHFAICNLRSREQLRILPWKICDLNSIYSGWVFWWYLYSIFQLNITFLVLLSCIISNISVTQGIAILLFYFVSLLFFLR